MHGQVAYVTIDKSKSVLLLLCDKSATPDIDPILHIESSELLELVEKQLSWLA